MSKEYERLLREYNVPPGVLTTQQLRMLQEGGIRLDETDEYGGEMGHTQYLRGQQRSGYEMHSLREIYEEQLSVKDKQLSYLQGQIRQQQQLAEAQRHRLQSEHQLQHEKVLVQLRQVRAQVVRSEGQIPLIKEALSQVREMMTGLASESLYLRLREVPERELPASEWIVVNVWELAYPLKKEAEAGRREVGQLREEIKVMGDKQHALLNELEHYSRLLASKDDDVKRHALNYDNNRKCMELEIEKLREEIELCREKGARYDQLQRDYQFIKQEKELIQEKMGFYDRQVNGQGVNSADDSQRRKIDLLMQDKEYLTKENIQLIEKNRRLEDRLDRLEAELLSQKNRSQEFLQQLLNLKTESVKGYEQRIYKEINQMREKHEHEMEMAKNNLVDIYEKQLRFLKQAVEEKEIRLQLTQRQLREKTKDCEQMMLEGRDFQRKFQGDLSQTRIQLKIRSEQLERVSAVYQQTLANLNGHKLQNEMLREKLNVAKGEYYRAQANGREQMSGLKAQVAVMREQLSNYELIERQVDEAVISLADPKDQGIFAHTLHSVPTASRRRVQQALGLAQRLQAKQKQHEQTIEALGKVQQQLQSTKDELKIARTLLDKTNQPYNYLVGNIEEKEREVLQLRAEHRKVEQGYENLKQQYRQLQRQLEEADKDIQKLLVKRQCIKNIQTILVELTRGPPSAAQLNAAVEDIREALGTTAMRRTGAIPQNHHQRPTNEPSAWYRKLVQKKKH